MKRKYVASLLFTLVMMAAATGGSLQAQEQTERSVNNEYRNLILQYIRKDVSERQDLMRQRAEQLLLSLPNEAKLYDESQVVIEAKTANAMRSDSTPELNYVISIDYNCRNMEGATDDYGSGEYLLEQSNSAKALCLLAKTLIEEFNSDLFAAGKEVTVRLVGSTDAKPISHLDYNGEYGEFRYMPTRFNGESVRVSISSEEGISTNVQLAYIRAQGIRYFLQQDVPALQHTDNHYIYTTKCYGEQGSQYRRSSIEFTVHGAFDEMAAMMNEKLINDEFIEYNIPAAVPAGSNTNTFAIIIANENYEAPLPNCSYAWRDATVVREYCVKTLGIPERHVRVIKNASIDQLRRKGVKWLQDIATAVKGDANIIVYYAGYGITDADYRQYIIPCGMNLKKVKGWQGKAEIDRLSTMSKHDVKAFIAQCLPIDTLCSWFDKVTANNRVTMILDAGFNGCERNGDLFINMGRNVVNRLRPMRLRNDIVIFSAAAADKTAFSFDQQRHGFLTYFMMKELKRTKGDITYGELFQAVEKAMSYESSIQGKLQEPECIVGGKLKDNWTSMRFIP